MNLEEISCSNALLAFYTDEQIVKIQCVKKIMKPGLPTYKGMSHVIIYCWVASCVNGKWLSTCVCFFCSTVTYMLFIFCSCCLVWCHFRLVFRLISPLHGLLGSLSLRDFPNDTWYTFEYQRKNDGFGISFGFNFRIQFQCPFGDNGMLNQSFRDL